MEALLYFAIWAAVIFVMMRFGCGAHIMGDHAGEHTRDSSPSIAPLRWKPPESDVDPVCGKTVRTTSAKPSVHDGTVFYFCSRECREIFEAAPSLYPRQSGGRTSQEGEPAHG